MPAPEEISKLVQRYKDHRDQYKSSGYKETELRREFLDPLFTILGWDVDNKQGHAEQYKEVVHEKSLDVEGDTRAPDYSFRIGGTTKFFVEAKKPSVDITSDKKPAFQLKRYAWSAKLPLSILTNFEDFSVYDCRIKPVINDATEKSRILYLSFDELEERWDELCAIFTKESILKGSFDKYAQEKKRGTSEVDAEILKDIEGWREELAKNIAISNPDLSIEEMNFAVGRLIDRILFLRICEDRGTEPENQLLKIYETKKNIYRHLLDVFQLADAKYNSGLFHFTHDKARSTKADRITPNIKVDDRVLASIIYDLYYPNSPYQFDVIPADILGQVYEQFLGKVIRLTAGHHAKVEEKPEVKKAGGVYYTPTYIVDYIVENTVVKLCQGKTPEEMKKLKILDPACGSGSFLIVAYRRLMEKHLVWYMANDPKKHKDEVFRNQKDAWQLTLQEKKKILLSSIHGVDIDSQAVEVTKLNLLLKALEGESRESIDNVQKWFREPALPDLGSNIKCGNSLIDFDIIDHLQELSEEERDNELTRINPFNWQEEFSGVMKTGGFDAVVGNPPYLKIEHIEQNDRDYFFKKYTTCMKRFDSYGLFMEKMLTLMKTSGLCSFIVPSTFLNNLTFVKLREFLINKTSIKRFVNLGGKVFFNVNNDTVIFIYTPKNSKEKVFTELYDIETYGSKLNTAKNLGTVDLVQLAKSPDYTFSIRISEGVNSIIDKMNTFSIPAGELYESFQGFVTGGNDAYLITKEDIEQDNLEKRICKPAVFGDEIKRYSEPKWKSYVMFLTKDLNLNEYPNVKKRLIPYEKKLSQKREVKIGRQPWYALHWPRNIQIYEKTPKILVQAIRNLSLKRRIVATFDTDGLYADHTLNILIPKANAYNPAYLLGILNSSLLNFVFAKRHIDINIKGIYLEQLPIRTIDFSNKEDVARHDKMVKLVERMLKLHKDLKEASTPEKTERTEREIRATDGEIDRLVYELYGLTEEEIGIVEGRNNK